MHNNIDCCACKILSLQSDFIHDYSLSALRETVPCSLDNVSLSSIKEFAQKSLRFMDAYIGKDDCLFILAHTKTFLWMTEDEGKQEEALRETVPCSLDNVSLSSIKEFAQKSLRFMDAYIGKV
ncbi:hypothetical protein Glove_350g78 [Diversispora epigaea]|uniref:Uncharacterized protein n=1 Tax=Diversispora epigaea TaxID=1348612 RepID=A0A397HHI2_9GLOM|nr:hypothetical protein Glove_350g78 [Diversispora epigaea]